MKKRTQLIFQWIVAIALFAGASALLAYEVKGELKGASTTPAPAAKVKVKDADRGDARDSGDVDADDPSGTPGHHPPRSPHKPPHHDRDHDDDDHHGGK